MQILRRYKYQSTDRKRESNKPLCVSLCIGEQRERANPRTKKTLGKCLSELNVIEPGPKVLVKNPFWIQASILDETRSLRKTVYRRFVK